MSAMAGFAKGVDGPSPFGAKSMTLYTQGYLTIFTLNRRSDGGRSKQRNRAQNIGLTTTRASTGSKPCVFSSTGKTGMLTNECKVVSIEIDLQQPPFAVDMRKFQVA